MVLGRAGRVVFSRMIMSFSMRKSALFVCRVRVRHLGVRLDSALTVAGTRESEIPEPVLDHSMGDRGRAQ
jgi:hypothetical protein